MLFNLLEQKPIVMCEHLCDLENDMLGSGIRVVYRGQPWSKNCREWVYFDCYLDVELARALYHLPSCVEVHINNDEKSGKEAGLCCRLCHDAIMGAHPDFREMKRAFPKTHRRIIL